MIIGRTLFISAFFSENQREDYQKHCQGDRPRFLKAIETHLKSSDLASTGPYVIGNEFTYADMVLFQILHDEDLIQKEGKELDKFPRLVQLVEAVQNRPNIKKFFESNAYFG
jgi:glutathione S-transferase